MEKVKVLFKKLNERAKIPTYGSDFAAGADLYALCDGKIIIPSGKCVFVHAGLSLEGAEVRSGLIDAVN